MVVAGAMLAFSGCGPSDSGPSASAPSDSAPSDSAPSASALSASTPSDNGPSDRSPDCDSAALEALPVYGDAAGCLHDADPMNAAQVEECLTKARSALLLLEHAEVVCSGYALVGEVRDAREQVNRGIPNLEQALAYHRGEIEIEADEFPRQLLEEE